VTTAAPAGLLLREWRERRRLSQLDLALLAGISTRHLSCVETGRSRPSPEMVLRLAESLDIPLGERNRALLAAGYAPAYEDARADPAATRRLLDTLDLALDAHEPWPALVLDAHFDVVAANAAVDRLLALVDADLLDLSRQRRPGDAAPPRHGTAHHQPAGLARVPAAPGPATRRRRARRRAGRAARRGRRLAGPCRQHRGRGGPVVRVAPGADVGGTALRLYSTVATFGTPLDVAASEQAIETFLPADDVTRAWLVS